MVGAKLDPFSTTESSSVCRHSVNYTLFPSYDVYKPSPHRLYRLYRCVWGVYRSLEKVYRFCNICERWCISIDPADHLQFGRRDLTVSQRLPVGQKVIFVPS